MVLSRQASTRQQHRLLVWAGHLFFLCMLVMSVVFYQERMLSLDTANYAFELVMTQDFYTGQSRTLTYITQLLPLLALKWGWSLKAFLIIYSASFILFYQLIYTLIVHLFRNAQAGIFLALSLCLTLRYKFYGPVGEVVLSIAILALLIGWVTRPADRFARLPVWLNLGIGMALASLLLTGHPFIAVTTAIFYGFDLIHSQRWRDWQFWTLSLFTGLIFLLKTISGSGSNQYTEMRMDRLHDFRQVFTDLPHLYITDRIRWFFETEYAFPFTVFMVALIGLWLKKQRWLAGYLFAAFWALLGLVLLMHNYLNAPIYIMLDGYLTHLGVLWALPLAFCWLPERRWWIHVVVGVLLIFGLDRISGKHDFFRHRIDYLNNIMATHVTGDERKLLAHMDQFDWQVLWMPWAVSFETLLISSLDGPDGATTLYYQQHHENWEEKLQNPDFFLAVHYAPEFLRQEWLPGRYFHLPRVPYKKIEIGR